MKDLKRFLNSFAKVNSDEYIENEYTFDLLTNNSDEVFQEALDKYRKQVFRMGRNNFNICAS